MGIKDRLKRYGPVIVAFAFFLLVTNPELLAVMSVVTTLGIDVFLLLILVQFRAQVSYVVMQLSTVWKKITSGRSQ